MKRLITRLLVGGLFLLVAALFAIQLIPYGRQHDNPPVVREPNWSSPQAREVAQAACFDCHSNETVWPWYANVAPMSWLVQHDVDEGREYLNFSEWGSGREGEESEELYEVMEEGEMPPAQYLLLHSEARLSASEKDQLMNALAALDNDGLLEHEENEVED
jgi:hypothetical protein